MKKAIPGSNEDANGEEGSSLSYWDNYTIYTVYLSRSWNILKIFNIYVLLRLSIL